MVSNKDKANSVPHAAGDESTVQPAGVGGKPDPTADPSGQSPTEGAAVTDPNPVAARGGAEAVSTAAKTATDAEPAAGETAPDPESAAEDTAAEPISTGVVPPAAVAAPPATAPAKGRHVLGTIAIVLAIGALAVSAYMWYRYEVQQKHAQEISAANLLGEIKGVTESTRALEKQQDNLASAQEKLSSAQGDLGKLIQEKLDNSVSALQQRQAELTDSVSKIYESLDRSIDSWALEEIEQLLRMANHSVALSGDVAMAATALELADKRLDQLGNPEYLDIRRFIADEITQLKAVEQVDLPGLAFRLSSLAASVNELALLSEPDHPIASGGDTALAGEDNPWLDAGRALLSDLSGLVRVQNVTEPAKPLLTPEQRYYLVANLRLLLSGAQIAVLRTDTQTFEANLRQASKWLSEYFDTKDSAVQAMITELNEMAGRDLTPERPNIAGSIAELQRVKQRMKSQ